MKLSDARARLKRLLSILAYMPPLWMGDLTQLDEELGIAEFQFNQLEKRVRELEEELVAERKVINHYTQKYEDSLRELARR